MELLPEKSEQILRINLLISYFSVKLFIFTYTNFPFKHTSIFNIILKLFDLNCKTQDPILKPKGAFTYDVSKNLANFTPPLSATVSIERPPLMTSAFAKTPPFQSDISFSKNPLHSTLIETLNVYLIQLKTERCHQFRGVY